MESVGAFAIAVLAFLIVIPLGIAAVVFLVVPTAKGIAWLVRQIFRFIGGEVGDLLRLIGAIITSIVLVPITLVNVLFGRWSSAAHYGRAIENEGKAIGGCVYRIAIGHPARLFCLTPLTEGLEQRVPQAVAGAPGPDRPPRRVGQFEGYTIVGSLPGGGSGSKLYIADPSPQKLAAFARAGQTQVGRVVIKSFSLNDGSTLPQIVRENRALPAAKRLGLILEHELHEDRFFYITRYVPGESLGVATQRLHALGGGSGLTGTRLSEALAYTADVVRTLHHYHAGGLWHKDVKPDNIIVSNGQAHLVDFGLVTPLRSSMTLTTHGTEYFRDPEMVRMALRGVKVHEVDGAKFDIYAAGAVLYSIIENSFPAHGGLSQLSRTCPEVLRWIVRRAMTDYDKRYESAAAMLADLETVRAAPDPFALKPVDLPSVRGGDSDFAFPPPIPMHGPDVTETAAGRVGPAVPPADGPTPPPGGFFQSLGRKVDDTVNAAGFSRAPGSAVPPAESATSQRPSLRVTGWWTGKYTIDGQSDAPAVPARDSIAEAVQSAGEKARIAGVTAAEQMGRAREAARHAREHARARLAQRDPTGVNKGVGAAFIMFWLLTLGLIAAIFAGGAGLGLWTSGRGNSASALVESERPLVVPVVIASSDDSGGTADSAQPDRSEKSAKGRAGRKASTKGQPTFTPSEPLGAIVVLKDSMTFDTAAQASVDDQLKALETIGFTLRGLTPRVPESAEALKAETELAAGLKTALGMEPFRSNSAAAAARAWLKEHEGLNMVVWIGRNDDGEAQAWIVPRAGLTQTVINHAASTMERAGARKPK